MSMTVGCRTVERIHLNLICCHTLHGDIHDCISIASPRQVYLERNINCIGKLVDINPGILKIYQIEMSNMIYKICELTFGQTRRP